MLLSNKQLSLICRRHYHTRDTFAACVTWDTFPTSVHRFPCFFIVDVVHSLNVQALGHWCLVVLKNEREKSLFFDPLGRPPSHYNKKIVEILEGYGNGQFLYNDIQVQSSESDNCGSFVLFVADKLNIGLEFHDCIAIFNKNDLDKNDQLVENYLLEHMLD